MSQKPDPAFRERMSAAREEIMTETKRIAAVHQIDPHMLPMLLAEVIGTAIVAGAQNDRTKANRAALSVMTAILITMQIELNKVELTPQETLHARS